MAAIQHQGCHIERAFGAFVYAERGVALDLVASAITRLRSAPVGAVTGVRMAGSELSVVLDGMSFLEGPRWHDGALYVSDFYTHRVLRVVPGNEPEEVAAVPNQPSGLGWLPDGRMLVVSMIDRKVLRQEESGDLVEHADLGPIAAGHVNDMVVAEDGTAYVGNFGFDLMRGATVRPAPLARVDPDGAVTVASEPLWFPNGAAITPDGSTLVVAESFGNRLSAFPIHADGTLGDRRDWAALGPPPASDDEPPEIGALAFAPDGMCLDADGAAWIADAIANRAVRLAEGGEQLDEIRLDVGCFACMLGGDDGRTLFLCTAPSFAEHERRTTREARLLAARVDVPHAGTP
jgi:sugar lactone lactonase YvrE